MMTAARADITFIVRERGGVRSEGHAGSILGRLERWRRRALLRLSLCWVKGPHVGRTCARFPAYVNEPQRRWSD